MKTYRVIALCFVMLLLTAGMAIDCKSETRDLSVGSGIDVSVFVYSERDPALSDEFIQRIENRTVLMLRAMMGSNANVQMLRLPNLNDWLREHRLSDLSTQQCLDFGCDKAEKKVILLSIRYKNGAVYISGAEFDFDFDTFGPVHSSAIVQRNMVSDAVARLAMKCWTPIGKINAIKNGRYSIGFANLARLMSVPNWSRLKKNSVLQLFRETRSGSNIKRFAHRDQFLRVETITQSGVWAVPIGEVWDSDWFQYIDHPDADYFVRRVTPQKGSSTVQVLLTGKIEDRPEVQVPRGGCDVYVSEAPRLRSNGLDRVVGVTNRDGIATIEVVSDNPVFVSVSYENVTKTRSFVRGVTPEPFVFTFEYLGGQSDYLNSINWLQDEVRANAAVINSLVEQVNSIAREGDPAKIAELTRRVSQLQNVDEFVQKANSIEAHAKAKNLDISERIKQFREVAEQLRLQTRNLQEKLDGAKMFANAEGQLEDFQNLFNAMKWPESLAALEKFSIDFPDHPHSRKLAGFRTAVQPKDQNHAQARETLLSAIGMTRSQTLMDRWDAMRSALEILLQHNDALYLATINAEWNEWKILFGEEIKEIVALNTSAPPADKPKLIVRSQHAGIVKSDFERLEPLILAAAKESRRVLD